MDLAAMASNLLSFDNLKLDLSLFGGITGIGGVAMAFRSFRRRRMLTITTCSINYFERSKMATSGSINGVFKFRTLFEKPLLEVLGGNAFVARQVMKVAKQRSRYDLQHRARRVLLSCTPKRLSVGRNVSTAAAVTTDPQASVMGSIIAVKNPITRQWISRCVSNHVSQVFAPGSLCQALGVPVTSSTFAIALTCEDSETTFFHKTRIMVVETKLLQDMVKHPDLYLPPHVSFEMKRKHHVRLQTIHELAREFRDRPEMFAVVELAWPNAVVAE